MKKKILNNSGATIVALGLLGGFFTGDSVMTDIYIISVSLFLIFIGLVLMKKADEKA